MHIRGAYPCGHMSADADFAASTRTVRSRVGEPPLHCRRERRQTSIHFYTHSYTISTIWTTTRDGRGSTSESTGEKKATLTSLCCCGTTQVCNPRLRVLETLHASSYRYRWFLLCTFGLCCLARWVRCTLSVAVAAFPVAISCILW